MRKLFARPLPRPDFWLAGVLLLALALRGWGLTWGLPSATHYFSYHPDESVVLETATGMNVFAGHLLPHFYNYGSLQIYLVCFTNTLAAVFGAVDIVPKAFPLWVPQWAQMYLMGRCLTVGMGVGTVWAVYAIGGRLWDRRTGLFAALTLAVMPLHAQHSHFLTVDVPATFWAMLSLVWATRLAGPHPAASGAPLPNLGEGGEPQANRVRADWRAALWAGVFAGLAAATKYNLVLALLPLAAACVMGGRPLAPINGGTGRGVSGSSIIGGGGGLFLIGLLACLAAFLLACPGAVLESQTFLDNVRFEAIHVQNADDPTFRDTGNGFVYQITRNLDAGLGLPLLLLTLGSVGYALYRRERGDGLLAAFALPYFILIGIAAVRYARYDIPLLPILALWTGRMLADANHLPSQAVQRTAILASGTIFLLTLLWCCRLVGFMGEQDMRDWAYRRANSPVSANNSSLLPTIGFAAQPWFGSVPISPYFSLPRPGAWQAVTSPNIRRRIIYDGKDWDTNLLETKKPDIVLLSEFDYMDALRLKDPAALHYFAVLRRDYKQGAVLVDNNSALSALYQTVDGMPTRGWPHDMLYTNPIITIYRRNTLNAP